MRQALSVTLALAAALVSPHLARAQDISSPYRYVEPTQSAAAFAGYLATDRGEVGFGPHSAPMLGGTYTIRLSGPLAGEVSVAGAPTQRTVVQRLSLGGQPSAIREIGDTDALLLLADAGLRFTLTGPRTWRGFAPYLAASGGLVIDVLGSSELEETIEATQRVDFGPAFAVSVGAGADWFLTERLALRLEARDRLWRLTTPEGLSESRRQESEWTNNLAVTLGAAFYF